MDVHRDELIEAAGLRVRFFWQGDRYGHEVLLGDGSAWSCALTSVEGSPEQSWPDSPPFQSLHVDRRGDGRAIGLLVGMAGRSHWSASAQIDARVPCVDFDVACRLREAHAGPLGSTYREPPPGEPRALRLEIEPLDQFDRAWLERRDGQIVRVAVDDSSEPGGRTIRWSYRLRPGPKG